MTEVMIVARKELRELLGRWRSPRATTIQGGVVLLLGGVLFPTITPAPWTDLSAAVMLYFVAPSAMAGMAAADAFAGERERRSLETLLATPLSDGALVMGKVASAVLFALGLGAATLASGTAVTNFAYPAMRPLLPPIWLVAGLLGGITGSALLVAACAVWISTRVLVARSAQQLTNLVAMALAFGVIPISMRWTPTQGPLGIALIDGILLCLGLFATALAVGTFRRDRLFR